MHQAPGRAGVHMRFVQRIQQQHQKGHVVGQGEPAVLPVPLANGTAEPAVALPIPRHLHLSQIAPVRHHIAEHQTLASR